MNILVLNSGSSSIKFSVYRAGGEVPEEMLAGEVSGVGGAAPTLTVQGVEKAAKAGTVAEAIETAFGALGGAAVDAVGYRVVHPGVKLTDHVRIDDAVLADLEEAVRFAPLHEPEAIEVIREGMKRFPAVGHYACFDTVFHRTMEEAATTYALPPAVRAMGVRRYGFHGLSCESVVWQMRRAVGVVFPQRMVIAHLGSGCSVTAVVEGKSADTTMGLTPTGGVVMGSRPGDLDPGVVLYLLRQPGATVETVEAMLNHDSGLKGLCGTNDVRAIRQAALPVARGGKGDRAARLALEVFTRSVRKAIAGFAATAGMEALVFTGGIGEHDAATRTEAGSGLWGEEPEIERVANEAKTDGLRKISVEDGNVAVYVVPAEEDLMIARHVEGMMVTGAANSKEDVE